MISATGFDLHKDEGEKVRDCLIPVFLALALNLARSLSALRFRARARQPIMKYQDICLPATGIHSVNGGEMGVIYILCIAFGLILFGTVNLIKPMKFIGINRGTVIEIFVIALIFLVIGSVAGPGNREAMEYAKTLPEWVRYFPGISFLYVFLVFCVYAIVKKVRRQS